MTHALRLSRWLGGKAWLTSKHADLLPRPSRGGRAFDVTAGSCVVPLWYLSQGHRVVIGDMNARLVGCLRNLQARAEAVIGQLEAEVSAYRDAVDQRADFYQRRAQLNRMHPDALEASALFLFVLRAGFNGLYRENAAGVCNTTWGDPLNVDKSKQRQHVRARDLVRGEQLIEIAGLLRRADIRCGDFEVTGGDIRRGDVLFMDLPYFEPGKFTSYSAGGSTARDRQRQGAFLRALDKRGVRWTATDARTDHALATHGLWTVNEIEVRRSVAANGSRKSAMEAIVRNWGSS